MESMDYREIAEYMRALSHPTRIAMVVDLLDGKKCVGNLEELVKAPQPNISQHLSLLKLTGVVDWQQEGRRRCYFLKDPKLIKKILELLKKR